MGWQQVSEAGVAKLVAQPPRQWEYRYDQDGWWVRVLHMPTGINVRCTRNRLQIAAIQIALAQIRGRLAILEAAVGPPELVRDWDPDDPRLQPDPWVMQRQQA